MILVLVETEGAAASEVSLETLALARSLSEVGGGIAVRAVVVGAVDDADALAAELGAHGVTEVLHATGDAFDAYGGASWAAAVQSARAETSSVVVTAAGTPRGNEVIAHLAARLDVPMAANVIAFSGLSPFTVTRQVVGGSAQEEMTLGVRPARVHGRRPLVGGAVRRRPAGRVARGDPRGRPRPTWSRGSRPPAPRRPTSPAR